MAQPDEPESSASFSSPIQKKKNRPFLRPFPPTIILPASPLPFPRCRLMLLHLAPVPGAVKLPTYPRTRHAIPPPILLPALHRLPLIGAKIGPSREPSSHLLHRLCLEGEALASCLKRRQQPNVFLSLLLSGYLSPHKTTTLLF